MSRNAAAQLGQVAAQFAAAGAADERARRRPGDREIARPLTASSA